MLPLKQILNNMYSISHFRTKWKLKLTWIITGDTQVLIHITFTKNKIELGYTFTLLIYSTIKWSSAQIIIAQKMQTYFFDFYYHFNPLQNYLTWFCQIGKTKTHDLLLKPMFSQKNLMWKDDILKSVCILALTYNFLKTVTTILE